MKEHTSGPWEYDGEYVEALDGDEPISICTLAEVHVSDEGGWQRMANARLIAAAPDLLAALEQIAEGSADAQHTLHCAEHRRIARAAIKKATGAQQEAPHA